MLPFARSLRSLSVDGSRRGALWAVLIPLALAVPWAAWFAWAEVPLYEVSERCRLESGGAAHALAAPVKGRVIVSRLALGRQVAEGEVLVELDATPERLALEEERARLASARPQLEAIRAEIHAEERALSGLQLSSRSALEEARARASEGEAAARLSRMQAERTQALEQKGFASEAERVQAALEEEQRASSASALRHALGRLEGSARSDEDARRAHLARLQREIADLEATAAAREAAIARLEAEIARRSIRAPVAGRLAEVADVRVGSVVAEGERLGAVVPAGALRAVAWFAPTTAPGRVRPGQSARLRLHAYPWTRFGSVRAEVTAIAAEPTGGLLRVELAIPLAGAEPVGFPLEHGLEGSAEVEVGRLSPASLVLESVGQRLLEGRSG